MTIPCTLEEQARSLLTPLNTPDDPVDGDHPGACQSASVEDGCDDTPVYEIVVFSVGSNQWVRMRACAPCTARRRFLHERLGPGGSNGIASITNLATGYQPCTCNHHPDDICLNSVIYESCGHDSCGGGCSDEGGECLAGPGCCDTRRRA